MAYRILFALVAFIAFSGVGWHYFIKKIMKVILMPILTKKNRMVDMNPVGNMETMKIMMEKSVGQKKKLKL